MARFPWLPALAVVLSLGPLGPAARAQEALPAASKWGLEVRTFGTGTSCGVYRRLSERVEFGVNLDGRFSSTDRESEQLRMTTAPDTSRVVEDTDLSERQLLAAPEVRVWSARHRRLSVFLGARVMASHRVDRQDLHVPPAPDNDSERRAEMRTEETVAGVGATAGARLQVFDHLGLLISLQPAAFSYTWGEETIDQYYRSGNPTFPSESRERRETTSRSPEFALRFAPGLFATLQF